MMIEFVYGRSGRGKTQYIFDAIKKTLATKENRKVYVIVPEQMSFQTEFALLQQVSHGAMMQVEVLGISRFLSQMIAYLEPTVYTVFDPLAQKMLLLQAALAQKKELTIYRQVIEKPEFIDYLHQFARALKGTGVALDAVLADEQLAETNPLLFQKLQETGRIFAYYQEQLEPQMFDVADKMQYYLALVNKPEHQAKLRMLDVYVDGYYTFNNLEAAVLIETLKHVNEGKITFSFDADEQPNPHSLFTLIRKQFNYFAQRLDAVYVPLANKQHRFAQTPLLDWIERHYEEPKKLALSADEISPIDIHVYQTVEQEIRGIAQAIRRKLLSGHVRAKEIALYLPEKELYGPIIEKYFTLYDIPYYLDLKASMLIHPVFNWFFSLLQIVKQKWQMEDILNLLHNDFFRVQHQIALEDYYLFVDFVSQIKYPYKKIWHDDKYWQYYNQPQNLVASFSEQKTARIQKIRHLLMTTIQDVEALLFVKATKGASVLRTLFEYIQKQNVYQYIVHHVSHREEAKYLSHVTEAQYQETVWKQFIYLFDQAHLALGEVRYQRETLISALLLGLEEATFTSVPQGFDGVMIGDFSRTKFQTLHQETDNQMGIQYAYIVGVNDHFIPHQEQNLRLLSAEELTLMQEHNMLTDILLQDAAINYQLFHFYTLVTSASKEVHLSYYQYGGLYLEDEYFPSPILKAFTDGFGIPVQRESVEAQETNIRDMTLAAAKQVVTSHYVRHATQQSTLWQLLQAMDAPFMTYLKQATNFKNDVQFTRKINVPEQFSITQLETYNRCPYQYFLKHVLKIKPPYEEKIQRNHLGIFLHGAYEMLALRAQEQAINVSVLDAPKTIIKNYFAMTSETFAQHPLFRTLTNRYVFEQTEKIVQDSLRFILQNEAASSFIPHQLEYQVPVYELPLAHSTALLSGKLDRIDIDRTGQYLRIIDYKSSAKSLDFNQLLYGTQLQLPVYTFLAMQNFAQKFVGSMYVPVVANDLLVKKGGISAVEINADMQKNYRATGFFLDDTATLATFDKQLVDVPKSQVIAYERAKSGQAGPHAMVFKQEELDVLQDVAMQQTIQTVEKINEHAFSVTPLREEFNESKLPCEHCPFRSICQFDKNINHYNDKQKCVRKNNFRENKAQFLQIVTESEKDDA